MLAFAKNREKTYFCAVEHIKSPLQSNMSRKNQSINEVQTQLSALLNLLDDEQCATIKKHATVHTYKKNELIYQDGELPVYLYCLISGKVKIFKDGVGGRSQIVRVLCPVDYFGYRAAFAGQHYVTSAAALEASVVVRIPISTILHFILENARLGWFFTERLAMGWGVADERVVSLTQKHIRGRLAESLLFLLESYGVEEDGCTLSIYLSREDLAGLSNMTTANAIRTLSAFASEKMVAVDGRKIKILEKEKLEKISRIG